MFSLTYKNLCSKSLELIYESLELVSESLELVSESLELVSESLEHRFIHKRRTNSLWSNDFS